MAVGLAIMGGAAAAQALGALGTGLAARKSATKQAEAQKRSLNAYSMALQQKAAKERGGISEAQRRQMLAGGSLQRASEGQRARDEARRGGNTSVEIDKAVVAATQAGAAQQMQGVDAMSQQQSLASKQRRDQLEMEALQSTAQAQAIDPKAIGKQAMLGTGEKMVGAFAQPASQLGAAAAAPQFQAIGQRDAMETFYGPQDWSKTDPAQFESMTQGFGNLMGYSNG